MPALAGGAEPGEVPVGAVPAVMEPTEHREAPSRRREFCYSAAPPSPFSKCFNMDGEGVSVKRQSRRRLEAPLRRRLQLLELLKVRKTKAASQPRRQLGRKAKAASQPRRQWERKVKGGVSATEAVGTQGKKRCLSHGGSGNAR